MVLSGMYCDAENIWLFISGIIVLCSVGIDASRNMIVIVIRLAILLYSVMLNCSIVLVRYGIILFAIIPIIIAAGAVAR